MDNTEAVARAILDAKNPTLQWEKIAPKHRKILLREAKAAIAAHLEALKEQGFVVVPIEPTEEMVSSGWFFAWDYDEGERREVMPRECWQAMLKAHEVRG